MLTRQNYIKIKDKLTITHFLHCNKSFMWLHYHQTKKKEEKENNLRTCMSESQGPFRQYINFVNRTSPHLKSIFFRSMDVFYGISTLAGYLIPNPVYTLIYM